MTLNMEKEMTVVTVVGDDDLQEKVWMTFLVIVSFVLFFFKPCYKGDHFRL